MAFGIFQNPQDLAPIAAALTNSSLKGADKTLAGKIWNGGFSGWASAPVATVARQEGDVNTRCVVINAAGVTLQNMIDLLRKLAGSFSDSRLMMLGDDMSRTSGAQEPWT